MHNDQQPHDAGFPLPRRDTETTRAHITTRIRDAGKALLPRGLISETRNLRACRANERLLYLNMRLLDTFGWSRTMRSRPHKTARSFLFVCFGNIMRSPMCEALMKRALSSNTLHPIDISSAGLNATPGTPAHPWAISAARDLSISLEDHRAKQLTTEMIDRTDVIFVMDYQNRVQILSRYAAAKNKVFLMAVFSAPTYSRSEILDPYYEGLDGTRRCYQILKTCVENLVGTLAHI